MLKAAFLTLRVLTGIASPSAASKKSPQERPISRITCTITPLKISNLPEILSGGEGNNRVEKFQKDNPAAEPTLKNQFYCACNKFRITPPSGESSPYGENKKCLSF
jgi:hypothetical protein